MKKFRPYKAGYIVLYVLCALCIGDAVYALIKQFTGTANEFEQSFSMFSYLIAVLAFFYVRLYIGSRVAIDHETFHFVNIVYIRPQPGEKRASFIYRQGDTDLRVVNKKFALADLERYGYIEDLGYSQLDKSSAGEKNKLFPVHEMALVMKDGKRYHMNAANYSDKQLKEIVNLIQQGSGIAPEGKLAKI